MVTICGWATTIAFFRFRTARDACKHSMKKFLLLSLLACALNAANAEMTAPVKEEIRNLLTRLEQSGCEFNRNGSWYSGAEAKSHLMRKLDYVDGKFTVKNTEQFIDMAASQSSSSGKAYQVRCQGAAPVNSAIWLKSQLQQLRSAGR